MTSQQKQLINSILLSVQNVKTMDQLKIMWNIVEASLRQVGIVPGPVPTSLPQAKSVAAALRKRVLSEK